MEQFTTLTRLKAFIGITDTANNDLLTNLIQQNTSFILAWLSRDTFLLADDQLVLNGKGSAAITLPEWPVLGVSSVMIDGVTLQQGDVSSPSTPGYRAEGYTGRPPGQPQRLFLTGYRFARGVQNVAIQYQYGYAVLNEKQTPSGAVLTRQQYGNWARDEGVLTAAGAAMSLVASAPTLGQYTCNADGKYGFNASEPGQVQISYSYVPAAIEKACVDMCLRRYNEKGRAGQRSISVGGETTSSYDLSAFPDDVKQLLMQYRKVFQPC